MRVRFVGRAKFISSAAALLALPVQIKFHVTCECVGATLAQSLRAGIISTPQLKIQHVVRHYILQIGDFLEVAQDEGCQLV